MRLDIYEAADGWRWTLTAANGLIVGASTEAYMRRAACADNAASVTKYPSRASIKTTIEGIETDE